MKLVSQTLIDEMTARSAASPRRRAHHNLHSSPNDLVQRFVVVAHSDTYIRPHRHLTKSELCTIVRGRFEVVVFDAEGAITERSTLGEGTGNLAFELPAQTWHTLLVLSDGAAFVEVKEGPYDPSTAAEFARWAPEEGRATADFQRWVKTAPIGARVPSFT